MPNSLAQLLTETAAAHADRPALKLDDTVLNYAVLNEGATRIAGLLKEKGIEPGDRVGIMLPERPVLRRRLLRHPAGGRGRGADERAPEGARGRVLPQGLGREGPVRVARLRRGRDGGRRGGRAPRLILVKPGEFEQLVMDAPRARGGRAARGRRHRGDPLHVGHDRHAEGRRAHARQPARELHGDGADARADHRGGRDPRRAAAVSLLRADVRAERRGRHRRLPDADPALRSRQGAGDHRAATR